jgi:hypothetical protein
MSIDNLSMYSVRELKTFEIRDHYTKYSWSVLRSAELPYTPIPPKYLGWTLDWLAEDRDLFVVRKSSIVSKIVV